MEDQFLFFCTNIGNELLLKKEIETYYPELALSYSRKGFITYKNKGIKYGLNTIAQLNPTFSTRCGICLGKARPQEISSFLESQFSELKIDGSKVMYHSFSINTDFELDLHSMISSDINKPTIINKTVFDIMALGEKEVWVGVHRAGKEISKYPNSLPVIEAPDYSPSRGYEKFSQIIELNGINVDKKNQWIDFGSAPGGISQYLLDQGCRVLGVDTAKMDEAVKNHLSYTFIRSAVQDLSHERIPLNDVQWINADLNLNPEQSIKEVLRLAKKYNHSLEGLILTVQMTNADWVKDIEKFEDLFYDWGFNHIISRHVPAHKKEYVIIATR